MEGGGLQFVTQMLSMLMIRKSLPTVKLSSLFSAWLFWTLHNKSHNMKALVILSHSWSPFLPLTCLYGKKELLWVLVWPSGVFSWEKTPSRLIMQITWPWTPVGRFGHGLITVGQKKCEHKVVRIVFVYFLLSTCHWVHMALAINRPDIPWCKILMKNLYTLFLCNIIKNGESDVQWPISI